MKTIIITVAGTSTRFNKDIDIPTLKCLYHDGDPRHSLLYQILDKARDFDEYIIVGGYLFEQLEKFINQNLKEFKERIHLVFNPEYSNWGSGYSLKLGITNANPSSSEIIFVEGDLFFSLGDFNSMKTCEHDAVSINYEPILAKKAVVFYISSEGKIKYLYDTSHQSLEIKEKFTAIYNSAQIWKFTDVKKLKEIASGTSEEEEKGTNLIIIQKYFGKQTENDYEIIPFKIWHNCNTVSDYNNVSKKLAK